MDHAGKSHDEGLRHWLIGSLHFSKPDTHILHVY